MGKWMYFLSFVAIIGFILTALLAGGGFAATQLTLAIPASGAVTTIHVSDVTGFLDADALHPAYVQIDDEVFYYTNDPDPLLEELTGVVRAQADPQTTVQSSTQAHVLGSEVATLDVKGIDSFMGYNITSAGATFGAFSAMTLLGKFFTNIPKYIEFDYPWFVGMGQLVRYCLFAFSMGFILSFALAVISTVFGIFSPK